MRLYVSLIATASILVSQTLLADETATRRPSSEQIVERLTAPGEQQTSRTRSWRGISVGNPAEQHAPAAPSLDLEVNFEFASARLSADARSVLDSLGQALNNPALAQSQIRIVGHTDAKGDDTYNLALSRERARAVAQYLGSQHGIASGRLSTEGKGRSELLMPADPFSALNRRVQVINQGKQP